MIQPAKCSLKGKWFAMLPQRKLSFTDTARAGVTLLQELGWNWWVPSFHWKPTLVKVMPSPCQWGHSEGKGPSACLLLFFQSTQTHLPVEPGCCIPTTPAAPLATTPSCCQKVFLAALFI